MVFCDVVSGGLIVELLNCLIVPCEEMGIQQVDLRSHELLWFWGSGGSGSQTNRFIFTTYALCASA